MAFGVAASSSLSLAGPASADATDDYPIPHRIIVTGPTRWRGQEVISPPALRPAVCLLLAALAARGTSVLRDVYVINRGYEDLPNRLSDLPADKDREIICYCKISLRGYEAALVLKANGWTDVKVMEGGVMAWPFPREL